MGLIIPSFPIKPPGGAGWTPRELFTGGHPGGWWDIQDISSMFQDNGTTPAAVGSVVARINDKSGNGNHLYNTASGWQPILRQQNGLYYFEHSGSGQFSGQRLHSGSYGSPGNMVHTTTGRWTACATVRPGNGGAILDGDLNANRIGQYLGISDSVASTLGFDGDPYSDTAASVTLNTSTNYVLTGASKSSSLECYANKQTDGTSVNSAMTHSGSTIFTLGASGGGGLGSTFYAHFNGRIYQAFFIGRELTALEQATLETFMGNKGGISI
jgi:hypothetical protein